MTRSIKYLFLLLFAGLCSSCHTQNKTASQFNIIKSVSLDYALKETSGLAYHNGFIWSHNDSGAGPYLYKTDHRSGKVIKQVKIDDVKSKDWEDMAIDDQYIYVADFGNNDLKRKKLRIIKIALDSLAGENSVVRPEKEIEFKYPPKQGKKKNARHDAEALIAHKDKLYIITKERSNYRSKVYSLNKEEKEQEAKYIGELDANGLITGGCTNTAKDEIFLVGYRRYGSVYTTFLWQIKIIDETLNDSKAQYFRLPLSNQIEGIACDSSGQLFISAEAQDLSHAKLYQLYSSSELKE